LGTPPGVLNLWFLCFFLVVVSLVLAGGPHMESQIFFFCFVVCGFGFFGFGFVCLIRILFLYVFLAWNTVYIYTFSMHPLLQHTLNIYNLKGF
jgi:hypothetical protein